MFRQISILFQVLVLTYLIQGCGNSPPQFFEADNPHFQYTGRIDFTNLKTPRFWTAGVYIKAKFRGTFCEIEVNDEVLWGNSHNYLEVSIDGNEPIRIKTKERNNVIRVADNLSNKEHTIILSKGTEALMGYIEFIGMRCEALLPLNDRPSRKIEFIGNSITSGMGSDTRTIPCDSGQWYDQHSAWFSYGAITARKLQADFHLTSESGIGLIRNCCNKPFTLPRVFDKISLSKDSLDWNFSRFQPDVVTICLGQNDGIQDSIQFTGAYVEFIKTIRSHYPAAQIVCLTSPMADENLRKALSNYLKGVIIFLQQVGEQKVDYYTFQQSFNKGCGSHPDISEHQQIADQLSSFLAQKMGWRD